MIDTANWPQDTRNALTWIAGELRITEDALVLSMVQGMLALYQWTPPQVIAAAPPPPPKRSTERQRVQEILATVTEPIAATALTHLYNKRFPDTRMAPMRMATWLGTLAREGAIARVSQGRYQIGKAA